MRDFLDCILCYSLLLKPVDSTFVVDFAQELTMSEKKVTTRQAHLEHAGSALLRVKLSGDLLDRVEAISEEMDVAPEEVVRLAVQRVVGGMAPELETELKIYISTTGIAGSRRKIEPGIVDRHFRQGPAGGGEIVL